MLLTSGVTLSKPPGSPPRVSVPDLVCFSVEAYLEGRDVAVPQGARAWALRTETRARVLAPPLTTVVSTVPCALTCKVRVNRWMAEKGKTTQVQSSMGPISRIHKDYPLQIKRRWQPG